ncbi:hypothetical protein G4228_016191 [Cervus hanglu yarkandensis]|nr:hypothetical protein G4228_016191 [Cervus hanglu yarkandensis]
MEWKLERTARRRVRTEEEILWEDVMRVLDKDMKQKRGQVSPKVVNVVNTTYSNFTSNLAKRRSAEVPVASSPMTTRWRQSQARDVTARSFGEEQSTTDLPGTVLKMTPGKETVAPGSYKEPLKTPNKGSSETNNSALQFGKAPYALQRGWKDKVASKGLKCLNQLFSTQNVAQQVNGSMQLCERSQCTWKGCSDGVRDEYFQRFGDINYSILQPEAKIHLTGLRNDYYLNILDWNFQNLVAIALGSSVYIWNGDNHNRIENIYLSLTCNYISSVSWIKEGTCLAVGTSEGEVQAIDWCPWQTEVLAVGGGMKDGRLHILDINTGQSIQTPSTNSQICSLTWLPKTKEIATGQGSPKNDVTMWTCPGLARSRGFFGKYIGR